MINHQDLDDRISKCQRILTDNPKSQIFAALADAYRRKGGLDKAFQVCAKGLEIHPNYGPAHVVMAKIYMYQGKYDLAEREVNIAIQADGATRATEILLSEILIKRGYGTKAKTILGKLRVADPSSQVVKDLLVDLGEKVSEEKRKAMEKIEDPIVKTFEGEVDLNEALDYLKTFPKVFGAAIVGLDGLILEERFRIDLEKDVLGAISANLFDVVQSGLAEINLRGLEQVVVESGNWQLWTVRLEGKLLIICCSEEVNVGSLRMKVRELLDHLTLKPKES